MAQIVERIVVAMTPDEVEDWRDGVGTMASRMRDLAGELDGVGRGRDEAEEVDLGWVREGMGWAKKANWMVEDRGVSDELDRLLTAAGKIVEGADDSRLVLKAAEEKYRDRCRELAREARELTGKFTALEKRL